MKRKLATCQGVDYTSGCLLDYNFFKGYYKMIAIDLTKQQARDTHPKQCNKLTLKKI